MDIIITLNDYVPLSKTLYIITKIIDNATFNFGDVNNPDGFRPNLLLTQADLPRLLFQRIMLEEYKELLNIVYHGYPENFKKNDLITPFPLLYSFHLHGYKDIYLVCDILIDKNRNLATMYSLCYAQELKNGGPRNSIINKLSIPLKNLKMDAEQITLYLEKLTYKASKDTLFNDKLVERIRLIMLSSHTDSTWIMDQVRPKYVTVVSHEGDTDIDRIDIKMINDSLRDYYMGISLFWCVRAKEIGIDIWEDFIFKIVNDVEFETDPYVVEKNYNTIEYLNQEIRHLQGRLKYVSTTGPYKEINIENAKTEFAIFKDKLSAIRSNFHRSGFDYKNNTPIVLKKGIHILSNIKLHYTAWIDRDNSGSKDAQDAQDILQECKRGERLYKHFYDFKNPTKKELIGYSEYLEKKKKKYDYGYVNTWIDYNSNFKNLTEGEKKALKDIQDILNEVVGNQSISNLNKCKVLDEIDKFIGELWKGCVKKENFDNFEKDLREYYNKLRWQKSMGFFATIKWLITNAF